jgi:hypothetical protein
MLRRLTRTIRKTNGEIKFMSGTIRDFPRATWEGLAASIGEPVNAFSVEIDDHGRGSDIDVPGAVATRSTSTRRRLTEVV